MILTIAEREIILFALRVMFDEAFLSSKELKEAEKLRDKFNVKVKKSRGKKWVLGHLQRNILP